MRYPSPPPAPGACVASADVAASARSSRGEKRTAIGGSGHGSAAIGECQRPRANTHAQSRGGAGAESAVEAADDDDEEEEEGCS
jgi:hypothetical protein